MCRGCHGDLPWQREACARCALPLPPGADGLVCGMCLRRPPPQDAALAVFSYAPPIDFMVQRLKFRGELAWARTLGELMAREIMRRLAEQSQLAPPKTVQAQIIRPEIILPVPLHRRRLAERGYNQALQLARPLSRALAVPIDTSLCERIRPTPEQSGLGAGARRANIRGAFALTAMSPSSLPISLQGASIAIIDDVFTTGSTAGALAHLLRRAGARHVSIWICARATLSRV